MEGGKNMYVDLRSVIADVVDLLRSTLPPTLKVRLKTDDEPLFVLANETQIHQILINLSSNSAHAMENRVAEMDISLTIVRFDEGYVGNFTKLDSGSYARLTVADNGHGMDDETIHRIFDPFFTTKDVGEGTGLGLAMVHGIVANHGGGIEVESEPGLGTTFTIYIPLADQEEEALVMAG